MRYKVRAPSLESFIKAERIARADTHVFVAIEGRRLLSVGNLSDAARLQLIDLGVTIRPDIQYDAGTT